jgi:hypothetical protein
VTAGVASEKVAKIKFRPGGCLLACGCEDNNIQQDTTAPKGKTVTGRVAPASHVVATAVLLNGLFTLWIWATPEAAVIEQLQQGHLVACHSVSVILLAGSSFVPLTPSHAFLAV